MTAKEAFQHISKGGADDFAWVIEACESVGAYCLLGGLAVNCYVDPVYTLDADLIVHATVLNKVRALLEARDFRFSQEAHSLNAQYPGSDLRIQFTEDVRYQTFPDHSERHEVFGLSVKVAALRDIVQGKIWAWSDQKRRLSKRQKDQADLVRIVEAYPEFRPLLPRELQALFKGASEKL